MKVNVIDEAHAIVTAEETLSPERCAALIARAEDIGFSRAPITTDAGPVMAPRVRNNERVMLDDPTLAGALWARVQPIVPKRERYEAVGLNERLRFYRYDEEQRFVWHRDGSFQREDGVRSQLTLMVYLNQAFYGGQTEIDLGEKIIIPPRTGMALLFDHHVLHQGAPVSLGRKYVLRTDVMYRRIRSQRP